MTLDYFFPTEPMEPGQAMVHIARKLAENNSDLRNMLDDEGVYSKYLDELLTAIGAGAEIGRSTYNGKKYISLGFIGEDHPKYKELVDYFKLREEDKECEDTN
ncbi:MAG: hypothetical protein IKG39_06070 [Lachnospiraceae bacterium]|nr:hypothetical protein [Lachnospiraceae bacterium]